MIADESCQVESDVDRCAGCFHGINIKLVKCGGMTPARRMVARARQLGLQRDDGLHDRIDRGHFGHRPVPSAAGLRRFGRSAAFGPRSGHAA